MNAYALIEANAADPVSSEQIFYQGAIPGLLRTLDPHSIFFDPGQFEQVKRMESSTQKGFGSIVSLLPGRVIILQTTPGTPSQKAGLAPGDDIVARQWLRDRRGSRSIRLQSCFRNRGSSRRNSMCAAPETAHHSSFHADPEELQAPSVDRAYMLRDGVGLCARGELRRKDRRPDQGSDR